MLSPKLLEILRSVLASEKGPDTGSFQATIPGQPISTARWNEPARRPAGFPASASPLPRILFDTHSPFICWNRVPMSAPFNCCSATAAWRPLPDICGSLPARSARPPVHSIFCLTLSALIPSPPAPVLLAGWPMDRPKLEVADIFRRYGEAYREKHGASMSTAQRRVMTAIEVCRTAALGGQIEQCDSAVERNAFATGRAGIAIAPSVSRWHAQSGSSTARRNFSTASTSTSSSPCRIEIAAIAYQNKEVVYNILFQATAETLRTIAADPKHLGAEIGFFAVLHTWGSALLHHPHLHCVVPGGGLSPDGTRWVPCKPGFFLHVRVLSRIVSSSVSGASPERLRLWQTAVLHRLEAFRIRGICPLSGTSAKGKVGRLCQATLRRPRAGAGLCRPLHPSSRDLEQSPAGYRSRSSELPMQGLSGPQSAEDHDPFGGGIHPSLSPPRFALAASTAFAITASSAIDTARKSWTIAANYWTWLHLTKASPNASHAKTIVIDTRGSPATRCANVQFAIVAR